MIILGLLTGLVAAWLLTGEREHDVLAPVVSDFNREALDAAIGSDSLQTESAAPARQPASTKTAAQPPATEPPEIKSLRSRIRFSLSTIYVAQKSYFNEHKRYTSDLLAAGWNPMDREKELPYRAGFLKEFIPETYDDLYFREDPRRMTAELLYSDPQMGDSYRIADNARRLYLPDFEHLCQNDCGVYADGFEFMLAAPLPGGGVDVWTINENKELRHVQDGLARQR